MSWLEFNTKFIVNRSILWRFIEMDVIDGWNDKEMDWNNP